jgi:bifunctional DNA-binding transcriptional regulator/antitoxin component of YhaV-PrlF toxin-antitoxin module
MRQPESQSVLDEQTCKLICPISAAMVGVCLTTIGLMRIIVSVDKVKAQGQISVPAEVRRQLWVGPGSVLVWEWRDDAARAGEFPHATCTRVFRGYEHPADARQRLSSAGDQRIVDFS